jgi:hypothetical protein
MPVKRSKQSRILLLLFALIGLAGLLMYRKKESPRQAIIKILKRNGIPQDTIDYWIAVSQFETAGWTSHVFNDSKNLFNIIVPGSIRLNYGEGQTIFNSYDEAAQGLVDHVLRPFKYPAVYDSPESLVAFMKSKNYFSSDVGTYSAGVREYYDER